MRPILIDTNLLVYLYDQNEPVKQARARQVLDTLRQNQTGRLSTQALSEFVNASMHKLTPPLTAGEAYEQVSLLASFWQVFDLTPHIVLEAARGVHDHGLAYYDAQTSRSNSHFPKRPIWRSNELRGNLTNPKQIFCLMPFAPIWNACPGLTLSWGCLPTSRRW